MRVFSGARCIGAKLNTFRIKIGTRTTNTRERSHCGGPRQCVQGFPNLRNMMLYMNKQFGTSR